MQPAINRENKKLDIIKIADRIFEVLLYITCLFPFTMWIPAWYTGTDSQPYAFFVSVFAIIYYVFVRKAQSAPKCILQLALCVFLLGAYAITDALSLGFLAIAKKYVTFASLLTIPLAFFYTLKVTGRVREGIIKAAIWIWLLVGLVQMWIAPDFAGSFVMRQTTDATRGVVSLATEPSAYGYYSLFLLLFAWNFQKGRLLYMGLVLLQILGFAQSTVTLIYIGVYVVGYAINEILIGKKYAFAKYLGLVIIGALITYIAYIRQLLPYRISQIIQALLNGDWDGLLKDGSIIKRLEGISSSVNRFINNLGLPQGFSGERYFSGNGILLVEGGFVSVIILAILARMIWKAYPKNYRFMFTMGFFFVMFSAIPYSCPMISLYLGYCCFLGKQEEMLYQPICSSLVKKWYLALGLAVIIGLSSGAIRSFENAWRSKPDYHPIVTENRYSSKEELIKMLSEEEYKEVEEALFYWQVINGTNSKKSEELGYISKEQATKAFNAYEVSFSYEQQRLCTIMIYECMGQDISEYLGTAGNGIALRTGVKENRLLFGCLIGLFGAIFVFGMYEVKTWNKG